MRMIMITLALGTIMPLLVFLQSVRSASSSVWRDARLMHRLTAVGLWLLASAFLWFRPHDERFVMLDSMAYRSMTDAFLQGRGFHDQDRVQAEVPKELREAFLFRPGPAGRPTRDVSFQLSGWQGVQTEPFFLPTLPLAAGGAHPFISPDRFIPLLGSCWFALLFAAGLRVGGWYGLFTALAYLICTAWPAWFLRGFHAEAVGGILVASAVLTAMLQAPTRSTLLASAYAAGLAVSYHPALAVLAGPALLYVLLRSAVPRSVGWMALGSVAGLVPLVIIDRIICQPYGPIFDPTQWWERAKATPEHVAIVISIGVTAICALAVILFLRSPRGIARASRVEQSPWMIWVCILAGVLSLMFIPDPLGTAIHRGALAFWTGLQWPGAILFAAGVYGVIHLRRRWTDTLLLVLLFASALFFLYLKSEEHAVGIWSQRRFLPLVLILIAVFVPALSTGLSSISAPALRFSALGALLLIAFVNPLRWTPSYQTIHEQGASAWVEETSSCLGTNRLVVFDYHPHSVPHAPALKYRVLGLGDESRDRWPDVASWISHIATQEDVMVVSSYAPCSMDEGFCFEPMFARTGRFPTVLSKEFFPSAPGLRTVALTGMRVIPLRDADTRAPAQVKHMDDGPIGLRGRWLRSKVVRGERCRWALHGAGVVGPVPSIGEMVMVTLQASFSGPTTSWTSQVVRITAPWGGVSEAVEVGSKWAEYRFTLQRPPDDALRGKTGVYSVHVQTPYDPAQFGRPEGEYPRRLAIEVSEARIEVIGSQDS